MGSKCVGAGSKDARDTGTGSLPLPRQEAPRPWLALTTHTEVGATGAPFSAVFLNVAPVHASVALVHRGEQELTIALAPVMELRGPREGALVGGVALEDSPPADVGAAA